MGNREMCVTDCIKKHIWKGIAIVFIILTIVFATLYATSGCDDNGTYSNYGETMGIVNPKIIIPTDQEDKPLFIE